MTGEIWKHHSIFSSLNEVALALILLIGVVYLFSGMDDLWVDMVALVMRLRPRFLDANELWEIYSLPEKTIAIVISACAETTNLERMLRENIRRLEYERFHCFVGIYADDTEGIRQLYDVQNVYLNVHPVIIERGPGYPPKSQMLNLATKEVFRFERDMGVRFDALLIQEAKHLIHPKALKLLNAELETCEFIQLPVLSSNIRRSDFVAGVSLEECAEIHTKELLVRDYLGAAIPCVDSGAAISRKLAGQLAQHGGGKLFGQNSGAESYDLGIRAYTLGYPPRFVSTYFENFATGKKEFIATRQLFPAKFSGSVLQKTKRMMGVALQGWKNVGWVGCASNHYFLWRDRKGAILGAATFFGYPCIVVIGLYAWLVSSHALHVMLAWPMTPFLLLANASLILNRLVQRMVCVTRIYGFRSAIPCLVRWPLAAAINGIASGIALKRGFRTELRSMTSTAGV